MANFVPGPQIKITFRLVQLLDQVSRDLYSHRLIWRKLIAPRKTSHVHCITRATVSGVQETKLGAVQNNIRSRYPGVVFFPLKVKRDRNILQTSVNCTLPLTPCLWISWLDANATWRCNVSNINRSSSNGWALLYFVFIRTFVLWLMGARQWFIVITQPTSRSTTRSHCTKQTNH